MGPRGRTPSAARRRTDIATCWPRHIQGKCSSRRRPKTPRPDVKKGKQPEPPKPHDDRQRGAGGRHRHALPVFLPAARAGRDSRVGHPPDLDNVTFVLNALDSLAGDNRFLDVRKRRPKYRTLSHIDAVDGEGPEARHRTSRPILEESGSGANQGRQGDGGRTGRPEKAEERRSLAVGIPTADEEGGARAQKETKIAQLRRRQTKERTKVETALKMKIDGVQNYGQVDGRVVAADRAAGWWPWSCSSPAAPANARASPGRDCAESWAVHAKPQAAR